MHRQIARLAYRDTFPETLPRTRQFYGSQKKFAAGGPAQRQRLHRLRPKRQRTSASALAVISRRTVPRIEKKDGFGAVEGEDCGAYHAIATPKYELRQISAVTP
jgi:hypothetical protein